MLSIGCFDADIEIFTSSTRCAKAAEEFVSDPLLMIMDVLRSYIKRILTEDKRGRIKQLGFPPDIVQAIHDFYPPWSHKYGDWMAREMLKNRYIKAQIDQYNNSQNKKIKKQALNELIISLQNEPDEFGYKFKTIFNWMDSKGGGPKLNKMTLEQAYEKAWLHPALMKSEKEGEVKISFKNGWKWIDLQVSSCDAEASAMNHCANDNAGNLWSLRDKKGYPHVTATVNDEGVILQMKGKGNSVPKSEYHPYIVELLSFDEIKGIDTEKDMDFHWSDLSEADQEKIKEENPDLNVVEQKKSTVEILRDGDLEEIKESNIFSNDTILDGISAIFPIFISHVSHLFRENDEYRSRDRANNILHGIADDETEYYRDSFDDNRDGLEDVIDEKNKKTIKEILMKKYPTWALEHLQSENANYSLDPKIAWESIDFDDIWFFLIDSQEDSEIYENIKSAWAETMSEAQSSNSKDYIIQRPVEKDLVDDISINENRAHMKLSYERLAGYIDIHHPGTPISGEDVLEMINQISYDVYGEELLASVDNYYDDVYGLAELDEDEFNKFLRIYLR